MEQSWRLKVDRAEKHLQELKTEVDRYISSNPYRAIPVIGGPKCSEHRGREVMCRRYRLVIDQPDSNLTIIAGDVVHNARSSLDHLAVSLAPRSRRFKASFPIRDRDPWEMENGRYAVPDDEARQSFETAIKGMDPSAVAIIKARQPYQGGKRANFHTFSLLSSFENADKHRNLVVIAGRLSDVVARIRIGSWEGTQTPPTPAGVTKGIAEDGAVIAHYFHTGRPHPRDTDVEVSVTGTPVVAIKVVEPDEVTGVVGYVEVIPWFELLIDRLRAELFPSLEPYVQPWARHAEMP